MASVLAEPKGLWTTYRARIRFRDRIMGGTPTDPKAIEGWIKKNLADAEPALREHLQRQTLEELGMEIDPERDFNEQLEEAVKKLALSRNGVRFKSNGQGPYIEARQVKAMLKEVTNILYAGERWGKTKKGPKSFLAERVFVDPDKILLGVEKPTGVEMVIGHVSGPKGPQSSLTYVEYVEAAEITFTVKVLRNEIDDGQWAEIWSVAQENGLGARRSQSVGRFDLIEWKRI